MQEWKRMPWVGGYQQSSSSSRGDSGDKLVHSEKKKKLRSEPRFSQ